MDMSNVSNECDSWSDGGDDKLQRLFQYASQQEHQVNLLSEKDPSQQMDVKLGAKKRKAHNKAPQRRRVARSAPTHEQIRIQALERENKSLRMHLESCLEENRHLKREMEQESLRASSKIRSLENALETFIQKQQGGQLRQEPQQMRPTGRLLPNLARLAGNSQNKASYMPPRNEQRFTQPDPSQDHRQAFGSHERLLALQEMQKLEKELEVLKKVMSSRRSY